VKRYTSALSPKLASFFQIYKEILGCTTCLRFEYERSRRKVVAAIRDNALLSSIKSELSFLQLACVTWIECNHHGNKLSHGCEPLRCAPTAEMRLSVLFHNSRNTNRMAQDGSQPWAGKGAFPYLMHHPENPKATSTYTSSKAFL
jgi:hypothetical protein